MASISLTSYVKADSRLYASLSLTVTQGTQSVEGNYTNVNFSVSGKQTPTSTFLFTGTSRNPAGTVVVTINGSTAKSLSIPLLNRAQGTCSGSGTVKVPHNADGTKTVSFSLAMQEVTGNYSGDTWKYGSASKSGSLALTTIPRASSISSISNDKMIINGSNALTINISRASSSFTHTVKFTFGSKTYTTTGQGTSCAYTIPLDWIAEFGSKGSGTKDGTVSVTTYNGSTQIGSVVSKTFTLTCPAASTISSSTASIECNGTNKIEVNISRSIASFTHTVKWAFGNNTYSATNIGTSTSYAPPTSWLSAVSAANSGTGSVYVTTYYGDQQIGETVSKNFTMTVPDYTVTLGSVTTTLVQNENISDWTLYIQNYSKVKFTFNGVSGVNSSSITNYSVTIDGVKYTSTTNTITTNVLKSNGSLSYTAVVTDSRNKTASKTGTITVQKLVTPTYTSSTIGRYNGTELDDEGTQLYFKFNFAYETYNGFNSTVNKLYYKESSSSYFIEYGNFTNGEELIIDDRTFDITKSYDLRVTVVDELGNSIERLFTVSTARALIDVDGENHSVGLLMMASNPGTVHIGGAIEATGAINTDGSVRAASALISNSGVIELFGETPYIDFHNESSSADYTSRLIASKSNELTCVGNFRTTGSLKTESIGSVLGYQRFDSDWIGLYPTNDDAVAGTNRKGWIGHNSSDDLHIKNEKNGYIKFVTGGKVLGIAADSNGYMGFSGEGDVVRTPVSGLLPNAKDNISDIGSDEWRFQNGYFNSLDAKDGNIIGGQRINNSHIGFYSTHADAVADTNRKGWIGIADVGSLTIDAQNCSKLQLQFSSGQGIEQYSSGVTFIDFHSNWSTKDYSHRILAPASGNLVAYPGISNGSDRRLKKDIEDLDERYINVLKGLSTKTFRYIRWNDGLKIGFIAQDVEEVLKANGIEDMPIIAENGEDGTYTLDYSQIAPLVVYGWQEHEKKIKQLENEVAELKSLVQQLLK